MKITKDDITLIIAIIGAIGTLYSMVSSLWIKRKNLKISISNAAYRKDLHTLMLPISFENRSHLPITVTSVRIFSLENELHVSEYPRCVNEYTHRHGSEIVDRKFQYNLNFPIGIGVLGAVSGCILLDISPKEFEKISTPLTVQVRSTRGLVQKKQLEPNSIRCL